MTPVEKLIRDTVARDGPISVARYMEIALSHPEHGYYQASDPFGRAGDFITAPEISQMFGELVGLWLATLWEQQDKPSSPRLVELGPGRGTLMADALRAIVQAMPAFHDTASIHLVETSAALRTVQEKTLRDRHVTWHDSLSEVPDGPVYLIANEFFDALPVEQHVVCGGQWRRRLVGLSDDGASLCFTEAGRPEPPGPGSGTAQAPVEDGTIVESSPVSLAIATQLGQRVAARGGACLIFDYGYTGPATGDTLQAVRDHDYWPVLREPGTADLTAHVDFGALAAAFEATACVVHGPKTQGEFLRSIGLDARRDALIAGAGPKRQMELAAAHRRLVHPDEMGLLFKVLAVTRNGPPPPGFEDGERGTGAQN